MKIAVLQMTSGITPETNAETIVAAAAEAARGGAVMMFTPEMSGLIDRDRTRGRASVRGEDDDVVLKAARASAAENNIWISLGSLAIAVTRDDGRLVNRSFLIDATGDIVARYDKIHLFDVDLPTGESWRESAAYAPGEQAVLVDTPIGKAGLSICYDLRFPALYSALTGGGATILTVPAAFTVPTGQAHWDLLLRARAVREALLSLRRHRRGCMRTDVRRSAIRLSLTPGEMCCSTWEPTQALDSATWSLPTSSAYAAAFRHSPTDGRSGWPIRAR